MTSLDMVNTYGEVFRPTPMDKDELREHLESFSIDMLERFIEMNEESVSKYAERKRNLLEQLEIDIDRERAWLRVFKQELRRRQDKNKEA